VKRLLAAGIICLVPLACSKEPKDYRLEGPGVIYEDDETEVKVAKQPSQPVLPPIEEKKPAPKLEPEPPEPAPIIEVKTPPPPKRPPVYSSDSVGSSGSSAGRTGRR